MLADCLFSTGSPFKSMIGFHQLEVRGDASGLIEGVISMAPVITLHHLSGLTKIYPALKRSDVSLVYAARQLYGKAFWAGYVGYAVTPGLGAICTVQVTLGYRVNIWWTEVKDLSMFSRPEHTWSTRFTPEDRKAKGLPPGTHEVNGIPVREANRKVTKYAWAGPSDNGPSNVYERQPWDSAEYAGAQAPYRWVEVDHGGDCPPTKERLLLCALAKSKDVLTITISREHPVFQLRSQ